MKMMSSVGGGVEFPMIFDCIVEMLNFAKLFFKKSKLLNSQLSLLPYILVEMSNSPSVLSV